MKKICLTMMMVLMTVAAMAQHEGEMALGLQVGFAQSDVRLNSPTLPDKSKLTNQALNGFKVGLVFEETFWKGMGSMVGFNYTYGGSNTGWQKEGAYEYPQSRTRTNHHAFEIFVDWQYKFEIAKNTYVILYSGPTIQCHLALDSEVFTKERVNSDVTKFKYSNFDYDDAHYFNDLNRLNVTWGVGAGFQYERYFLRGGYDFGLMNPYKVRNFNEWGASYQDRYTRGRWDQWQIKVGIYLWENK